MSNIKKSEREREKKRKTKGNDVIGRCEARRRDDSSIGEAKKRKWPCVRTASVSRNIK